MRSTSWMCPPQIHEELVDSTQMTPQERIWCMFEAPELAESPGEAGFSRSRTSDTTSTAVTTADTAVAKYVGEARPLDIAKHSATTTATTIAW